MCRVLLYEKPLAKVVLAPLLDDKRTLKGFTSPVRVCDRAAQAISHTTKQIKFDSDWSEATKAPNEIGTNALFCDIGPNWG